MDLGLRGKSVLITGSSRGIGRETARVFAREGAKVAITYKRDRTNADQAAAEIRAFEGDALVVRLDLANRASLRAAASQVVNEWGGIDVLVNNAVEWGNLPWEDSRSFDDVPIDEWRPLVRATVEGTFELIQLALPSMRARRWGRIVNVSATIAEDGLPGCGWYATAKAALHGLTRTLAKEIGPAGILVNCVLPGLTQTDRCKLIRPEVQQLLARQSPIRRVLDTCDVAPCIVYLSSAANTAITGQLIRVSGGL